MDLDGWCFDDTNFNYKKAHWLAKLAGIAYAQPLTARRAFKEAGITVNKYFDKEGAQAYGIEKNGVIFLAFRGTEPTQASDLLADAKAWHKKSQYGGSVHAGFRGEIDKIWPEIETWITKHSGKQIYVTGHSLGAAMSTIATSRLPAGTICYNYGSPRVGSPGFSKQFDSKYELHRFVNNNDAVCRVPLWAMLFRHVGKLHYINTFGNIRNATPWQRFKDRFRGYRQAWKKGQVFDSLYDHSMVAYTKRIGNFNE
tara:strand:+ start:741 stop:1505 length:765 start_codon:yes stop_codon:yes gene_type:complete